LSAIAVGNVSAKELKGIEVKVKEDMMVEKRDGK
jgi:hypothetical protein